MANPQTFKFPFIAAKSQSKSLLTGSPPDIATAPTDNNNHASTSLPLRPILTHLNEDTTWLLLLPYPQNTTPSPPCKYFRILLDPWLSGPQSDVYAWFSTQWHATPSSISTIAELTELIKSIDGDGPTASGIDAVFISHEFTDHCHKETLLELPKETPVFANDNAATLIKSWKYFDTVLEPIKFPSFAFQKGEVTEWDWRKDGRAFSKSPKDESGKKILPNWLGITRIESPGNALYYHSSVMVTFTPTADEQEISRGGNAECILYTPHGTTYSTLEGLGICKPEVKTLALLHGLHDVQLGVVRYKQLNLGGQNGIKCVRSCGGAKYWIGTHDERKIAGGFIKRMLWRKIWGVNEVVDEEVDDRGEGARARYVEIGNGETLVLE